MQNPNFIFQRGDQKLEIELDNQKYHLTWNDTNRIIIKFQNIDFKKLSFSGIGITPIRKENTSNQSVIQIIPTKELFKIDTLNLYIGARDSKDSMWHHKFVIPIKD
jgi:hypothetical protein